MFNTTIICIFCFSRISGHEKCTFHHDLELDHKPLTREDLLPEMARSYRLLLSGLGEDPDRQVSFIIICLLSID